MRCNLLAISKIEDFLHDVCANVQQISHVLIFSKFLYLLKILVSASLRVILIKIPEVLRNSVTNPSTVRHKLAQTVFLFEICKITKPGAKVLNNSLVIGYSKHREWHCDVDVDLENIRISL